MLPAKFRGLASRMGRLALNSFTAHKNHQTDGVREHQCANSTASAASASASADSDHHSTCAQTVSVDARTAHASRACRTSRTFRTFRTFRRALFALLVSVATLLAMLVVPAKPANAAQVWWDYAGNGYVTSNGSWAGDAVNQINMPYPTIEDVNYNGETRKKITWNVTFNSQGIGAKSASQNQFPDGNQPSEGSAYDGQPTLYAWLPSGIEDSSIKIYREYTNRDIHGGVTFDWKKARSSKEFPGNSPGDYTKHVLGDLGKSRWTYYKGDSQFEGHDWNKSLGPGTGSKVEGVGTGVEGKYAKDYDMCEVYAWKRENRFSRVFISQEKDDSTISYRWTISAIVDRGQNPLLLTFAAGWISSQKLKTRFVVSGPFDTDGDGIPDFVEHQYNMNPKSPDDILYPQFNESMLKDYGKDNVPITTYGRKITEKPYIKTGRWEGNTADGHFKYDGGTSTDLPTDLGIKYSIASISDNTIKIANSPNNIAEGYAYIDPNTGHLTYNPRKEDRNKTITFHTKISYPNSGSYNCKHKNAKEFTHDTKIKVVSQASLYNPYYDDTTVKAGEGKNSPNPKDRGGKQFPSGTKFKAETYNNYQKPPTWAKINNESTGVVTFHPNKWVPASKTGQPEKRPVVVYYPDGSTSKDKDSGNHGDPVNAPVYVTRDDPGNGDLQLHIARNQNGQEINYNNGFVFRKNRDVNPQPWIDSWSVQEPGDIKIRSVCADTTSPTNIKFYLDGINGIKINGEKPWPHATDEEQEKCRNGQGCVANKLFDSTGNTMERTRGSITGKPVKTGNYQCTVYALKPKALKKFEDAEKKNKNIGKEEGSSTNIISSDTFSGLREGIDYTSRTVPIKVHSDAHYYNPKYDKVYVKAGNSKQSAAPVSHRGSNGVKGDDKSQNDLVDEGTRLPKGTWFELRGYPNDKNKVRDWFKFDGKQSNKKSGENKPEDATSEEMYGKVTFSPNKIVKINEEYYAPVIVHYPDGSTSEDPDSGNLGKPVYAPVEVTNQDIQKNDLKLNVYSQHGGGRKIEDNDKSGMRFRKGDTLGDKPSDTYKPMFFDSWSSAKQGKIYQRMLCYKKNPQTGKPEPKSYEVDGVNGLKLAGRKGNIEGGEFTDKNPSQWTRANEQQRKECKANDSKCDRNKYLYGNERDTTERTWGWLHGKVKENGDFVCTVYAIKDLEGKGNAHGALQTKFDNAVKEFVKNPGDRKFEDVISKSVLTDKQGSQDHPEYATQRHIDWDSVKFPIHVHSDAHYYNPKYEEVTKLQAGETGTSNLPKSFKNANGAKNNQDAVKNNEPLPDGTWFEFKQYTKDKKPNGAEPLNYAFFENDDDNVKNEGGKKLAKNGTGQFGNVTFHPHRWINTNRSDNAPVIVHYPDGSTSEDPDSGNNGNPVYAKVNVVPHDYNPGDLRFDVTNNFNNGGWADKTIKIKKGDPLTDSHPRRLNLWSTHKPGKIELRTICHKIIHKDNTADTTSEYTWNGIAGITMENPSIWDHQEDPQKQHKCYGNKSQCDAKLLYDDYVTNGNSRNTTERTRASLVGKANESGDYECVVYAIKQGSKLLESFDKAVKSIKPDKSGKATPSDTDPLKGFKWKLDGDTGKKDAVKGVDYEYRAIQIQIHNDNHFYNPKYVDVSVTAGQKVENAVPQSVKSANGADKYQDAVKAGALPDGTWFEFKDATHGFEVNNDGTRGNSVSLDWSYWASGNAADKTGEQSNKPDNPSKQKNGKHNAKDDGTRYGKVTFHPDQSVAPKAYFKEIVIHYPDGSTSDDPDSGNNGKPVYAKVTVGGLSGADKDLKMTLLRSQDADPVHDTLGGGNSLTVMSGTSLTKNPYVRAWSLKDRSNISLRMMCTKQGEQKWSSGLDDTLNMHLNQNYGESVKPWAFASAEQRKSCSQDSKNCMANLLYGFTKDKDPNSIESAVSRSEDDIAGVPQKAGNYTCAVFALKPNALTVFNGLSSSADMKKVQLTGLKPAVDWNRISFDVNVIDPPKFALPKTGGEGMSMALLVVAMIGMCVMCGAFFVDQTKWGHAMLAGAAAGMMGGLRGVARGITANITQNSNGSRNSNGNRNTNSKISEIWRGLVKKVKNIRRFDDYSASAKDFVRKVTGWLRAALRRVGRWATERWRC